MIYTLHLTEQEFKDLKEAVSVAILEATIGKASEARLRRWEALEERLFEDKGKEDEGYANL